jgi:hypothetical protein
MDLKLTVQSVPIITKVVSSNPAHGEVLYARPSQLKTCNILELIGILSLKKKCMKSESPFPIMKNCLHDSLME